MKNSHLNHILNTFVQKPGNHMVVFCSAIPIPRLSHQQHTKQQTMSQSKVLHSDLEYCCAACWSHRIYHNSNLELFEFTRGEL